MKDLDAFFQRRRKNVQLFFRVIESERRARRAGNAEMFHDRLGAVMAGANGDAFPVNQGPYVMGMDAVDHE